MKHVLVTGGAGFIGSNFVRNILSTQPQIQLLNLDALTYAGSLENLRNLPNSENHTFVHGDICDTELIKGLLREHNTDTIVHFAAESHVDRSILGPASFVQTNLVGTFNLLEAARQVWGANGGFAGRRFHHVSTDEVYGTLKQGDPPFVETTPYDPHSPYSATKAGSDHLVRAYFHTFGLPVTLTNCSNNYGPYQFPEKLIPLVIINALQGKPLPIYGDGLQVRDWLFVADHCEAIVRVLEAGHAGSTYNIGGGNQPTNIEIVRRICALLDEFLPEESPRERLITYVPDRLGHDRRYAMDITHISTELGWLPRHDLEEGLRLTVEWYLSHPEWVEAISRQSPFTEWLDANYRQRGGIE
jgi:dTDP-glucose 4,6-dehydratase